MRRRFVPLRAASPDLRARAAPLHASLPMALAESVAGGAILVTLAVAVHLGNAGSSAAAVFGTLATTWLALWPAWRMRIVRGRGLPRLAKGIVRTLACAIALAAAVSLLGALFRPAGGPVPGLRNGGQVLFVYLWARLLVVVVAAARALAHRRLRWRLTISHLAVIGLTFAAMTAVGSAAILQLVVAASRANPRMMASELAALTRPSGTSPALDVRRVQAELDDVTSGRLHLGGEPALTILSRGGSLGIIRAVVATPDGRVLAGSLNRDMARLVPAIRATSPIPATVWPTLRSGKLRDVSVVAPAQVRLNGQATVGQTAYGAAPIRDPARRVVAIAIVQTPVFTSFFKPGEFVGFTLFLFGVSTILLIASASVPILVVASLFGYIMARGMARRLEAVSRVTTAIAAGDLSQRAPVTARDEVSQLADDVNRMAAHIEKTMSALQHARTQAEDALRARQELVASISHELRTPLAVVRAHLDNLAMQPVPASAVGSRRPEVTVPEATLHALQNETERLAALVDDLFALSRAQTGALQVSCEPVDVAALVDDVAALMRPLAQNEGQIALSVEATPGLPHALADPDRLRQILANLVRNAVRHTPDGGIIVLSVAAEDPWVVVAVADTGEGIPPEHLPHIFERFYRVDQARGRESGGAGLGLAIVREFVELMGGHVTVESAPGEGSCFRVYLPARR